MFEFIIKTENVDGVIITRKFNTASDFLEACESDDIDVAISFDDPIINLFYRGNNINISKFKNVDSLYNWMRSSDCNWL